MRAAPKERWWSHFVLRYNPTSNVNVTFFDNSPNEVPSEPMIEFVCLHHINAASFFSRLLLLFFFVNVIVKLCDLSQTFPHHASYFQCFQCRLDQIRNTAPRWEESTELAKCTQRTSGPEQKGLYSAKREGRKKSES